MRLSDFQYYLPPRLIAQYPLPQRDGSRLLVINRADDNLQDRRFAEIAEFISPRDALVINETKVIPARLLGVKEPTGARVEVFLLKQIEEGVWETLVKPARRMRPGSIISFAAGVQGVVAATTRVPGGRVVRFSVSGDFHEFLERCGVTPLPPYVKRPAEAQDLERYQTVYARVPGAVAAPTAGLHFTPELLEQLRSQGTQIIPIILHVGLGTFKPISSADVTQHRMEAEYYEISPEAAQAINRIKAQGGRICAVGTTCVRALESAAQESGILSAGSGWTEQFIYPPYSFYIVDALITNFHLPGSTLLMLVSAFAGRERILAAYQHAIQHEYRFYSYGDAMLIY